MVARARSAIDRLDARLEMAKANGAMSFINRERARAEGRASGRPIVHAIHGCEGSFA
jgi:hypothetical protein